MNRIFYRQTLILCIGLLGAIHLKAQSIAKLKISTKQGPQINTAPVTNALHAANSAIVKFKNRKPDDPLDQLATEIASIQQLTANKLFSDTTKIQNIAPQITRIDSTLGSSINSQTPLDTISWTTLTVFDSVESLDQLITSFNNKPSVVLLPAISQRLKANKPLLQFPGATGLAKTVDSILKLPLSDNFSTLKLTLLSAAGLALVVDTATTPASATSANCIKIDSMASFKIDKENDGSYICSILDPNDNPLCKFTITQFNEQSFYDALTKAVFGLCTAGLSKADSTEAGNLITQLRNASPSLYTRTLEAVNNLSNSQDLAGKLTIFKHCPVFVNYSIRSDSMTHKNRSDSVPSPPDSLPLTVYGIQIQFQDGFIENIRVSGKVGNDKNLLKFENTLPIAFTTKREYSRFDSIRLYEKTIHKDYFVHLMDVIAYNENFELDNKDYSPQNQVYTNDKITDSVTEVNLYKEQVSKILQARIFSDLKGFSGSNPNGLVQLELSKKLNLWSKRKPFGTRELSNIGWLNYITPSGSLSKIESTDKNLVLNTLNSDTSVNNPHQALTFASTINLLSHQQFRVGADLSIFYWDFPAIKSDFDFGLSVYYGSTPIQDTLRIDSGTSSSQHRFVPIASNNVLTYSVSTFQWGPYISYHIFPNPRFGFTFTYSLMNFAALTDKFMQVRDSANFVNYVTANPGTVRSYPYRREFTGGWISMNEIFAYYTPSESSQLFFRYRLYEDINHKRENFKQIQLGFTTYLTTTKKSKNGKSSDTQVTGN